MINLSYRLRVVFGCSLAAMVMALSGCGGDGSKQTNVSGKITYKGAPVTGGTLKFYPTTGGGAAIPGAINDDGTFAFGGVPQGDYTVTVETESIKFSGSGYDMKGKAPPPGATPPPDIGKKGHYVAIPAKYKAKEELANSVEHQEVQRNQRH